MAKARNAIAVADGGRSGEVRFIGEVDPAPGAMKGGLQRIAAEYDVVYRCYEAGPTGYGLHRLIVELGHSCMVVAPSLIPKHARDRVKTDRRDATMLARLLRAGELTAVWVLHAGHQAMRNLVRARASAVEAQRLRRQQVSAFMPKHGRIFPLKTTRGARHFRWLQEQRFEHPAH